MSPSDPLRRAFARARTTIALGALTAAAPVLLGAHAATGLAFSPDPAPAPAAAEADEKQVSRAAGRRSAGEVWQAPQRAHPANAGNPLADRIWGVYEGPQDQVWAPYRAATGVEKELIGKIALRPRTKWFGSYLADSRVIDSVTDYIESSQKGDPTALVQMAVFRMKPWEHEACTRPSTPAEKASYVRWIDNLATAIAATPTLVVMQPDGPFLWCVPDRGAKARLLTYATRKLSSLPATSVYIDAGAADWCENGKGADPARCAAILKRTGVRYARGFALDSTHYTGPSQNIDHGTDIVNILARDGYGRKHFIIDTAKSGQPTSWLDMIPSKRGGLNDDARTCKRPGMRRCVTLGIPPTVDVADPQWGLSAADRALAAKHVDGFVWFGRPWLYKQADPFVKQRALDMGRSTPWPGPVLTD